MSASKRTRLLSAAFGAGVGLTLASACLSVFGIEKTAGTRWNTSVYAGVSPDTGKPMYTTPKDAPLTDSFAGAKAHCAGLNAHGRPDWRVPTNGELNVLFQNRAAIGGFDTSGSDPDGWYWSSTRDGFYGAWAQRFSDGNRSNNIRHYASALRCVRG